MCKYSDKWQVLQGLEIHATAHLMHDDGLGEKENLGSYTDVLMAKVVSIRSLREFIDTSIEEVLDDEYSEGRQLRVTFRVRVPAKNDVS